MAFETGRKEEIFEVPYFYKGGEYLYSYGELSRFFREVVDNKRLLGSKCPNCSKVWMPPKGYCGDCYTETEWVPLSGKGIVMSCVYCYFPGGNGELIKYLDVPYVLGIIKLDGADTYIMHGIKPPSPKLGEVKTGSRVKAVFRENRKGTIADYYFVLEED